MVGIDPNMLKLRTGGSQEIQKQAGTPFNDPSLQPDDKKLDKAIDNYFNKGKDSNKAAGADIMMISMNGQSSNTTSVDTSKDLSQADMKSAGEAAKTQMAGLNNQLTSANESISKIGANSDETKQQVAGFNQAIESTNSSLAGSMGNVSSIQGNIDASKVLAAKAASENEKANEAQEKADKFNAKLKTEEAKLSRMEREQADMDNTVNTMGSYLGFKTATEAENENKSAGSNNKAGSGDAAIKQQQGKVDGLRAKVAEETEASKEASTAASEANEAAESAADTTETETGKMKEISDEATIVNQTVLDAAKAKEEQKAADLAEANNIKAVGDMGKTVGSNIKNIGNTFVEKAEGWEAKAITYEAEGSPIRAGVFKALATVANVLGAPMVKGGAGLEAAGGVVAFEGAREIAVIEGNANSISNLINAGISTGKLAAEVKSTADDLSAQQEKAFKAKEDTISKSGKGDGSNLEGVKANFSTTKKDGKYVVPEENKKAYEEAVEELAQSIAKEEAAKKAQESKNS